MAERPKLIAEALMRGSLYNPPTNNSVAQALMGTPAPRPTSLYAQGLLGNNVGYGLSNYPTPPQPTLGQAFGKDAYEFASGLTAPLSSLDRMGRTLMGQEGGWQGREDMIGDATTLASTFMGGGMAIPKPLGSVGIVGGNLASRIKMATKLPDDPIFSAAVSGTPGASITPEGLKINLSRHQPPDQGGSESIRTGVFYLPEGSAQAKFYKTGKTGYGGTDKIEGEAVIRNPLFVKGGTGGKAPEAAFDTLKGKGSYEKMRSDVLSATNSWGRPVTEEAVANVLQKYGADPDMAYEILRVTKKTGGNTLPYAVQENIVAHAIRDAGYDAMVGYSKGKNGPFISEVFDTREAIAPSKGGLATPSDLHPSFKLST